MSVDELAAAYGSRPATYDRLPPQNVDAEQSVLGAMMLSKDAMADVVEVVRGDDFYRPAHETIFDTAVKLYNSGDPVDALTVGAELQKAGQISRIGGAEYLHTLIAAVPSAASAGYYARLVREQSILRRLVEAGTRIANMGYDADGTEVDDVVDGAQAEIFAVTERRNSEDYLPVGDLIETTLNEIDAASKHDGSLRGATMQTKMGTFHLRPFGQPCIEGFFGGSFARELEDAGDGAFAAQAIDEIVALLGSDFRRKLKPLAESRWARDPFAQGAYSHALPGHAADRAVLAAPVDNRLAQPRWGRQLRSPISATSSGTMPTSTNAGSRHKASGSVRRTPSSPAATCAARRRDSA